MVFNTYCVLYLLPVSLDCPCVISPLIFSNVYLLAPYILCVGELLLRQEEQIFYFKIMLLCILCFVEYIVPFSLLVIWFHVGMSGFIQFKV
jgi:hypothetical protein